MRISLKNWERACRLQQEGPVADLHLDLPGELFFRHRNGEQDVIRRRYLPVWQKAGICLIGAAVYIEDCFLPEMGLKNALLQIEALREELKTLDEVCLICGREDLERAYRKEQIGILLYMEGLDFLGTDKGLLEVLSGLGVMGASLAWSRRNMLACGCCPASEHENRRGGITPEGMAAIRKMEELSMFLDISHLNDDGMEEIFEKTEIPLLATHSNARSVQEHYRNLTDEQLGWLVQRNGIVGINACTLLSGSAENGRHLEMLVRQGEYLLEQAGENRVCLGLDLCHNYELARKGLEKEDGCGDDALAGHEELVLLTAAFLEAGVSERQVSGILGENAFAFLRRVLPER